MKKSITLSLTLLLFTFSCKKKTVNQTHQQTNSTDIYEDAVKKLNEDPVDDKKAAKEVFKNAPK